MTFLKDFTMKDVIGVGSHAVVRKAYSESMKKNVAIKIYDKTKQLDPLRMKNLEAEIENLRLLSHDNIIKLYDSIKAKYHHFLVMEYIGGRSLYDYIEKQPNQKATEQTAKNVFKKIGKAIEYTHKNHVIHRDLKQQNILFGENKEVKIIDYGFSTKNQ